MKTVMIILLALFSISTMANQNVCNVSGGKHVTLKTPGPKYQYIDMCYFGNTGIEITSLEKYSKYQAGVWVVQKYIDNRIYWPKDCYPSGGQLFLALDSNDRRVMLCEFYDGSIMDARTFALGVEAPENMRMNSALGID